MAVKRIPELAAELNSSPMTIRREVYRGKLPFHRIGRVIVFTDDDVAIYLERCAASPVQE